MKISRHWAMPNSETFTIPPIKKLINRYIKPDHIVIDPFARNSQIGTITNDLNPDTTAQFHLEAHEFLKIQGTNLADVVLFDPPYSSRQITECYQNVGQKTSMQDTQSSFYSNCKNEISRIIKPSGVCISCCWNSTGIGKNNGFEIIEILIVCHGGWHNDTIITVERKFQDKLFFT